MQKMIVCLLLTFMTGLTAIEEIYTAVDRPPLTRKRLLRIAEKQIAKLPIDRSELEVIVDEGNKDWHYLMPVLRDSPFDESRKRYEVFSKAVEGKEFQVIYFHPKRIEGRRPFGDTTTVVLDIKTGDVLLVYPKR